MKRRCKHRLSVEGLEARLALAVDTWTGAGTDANWKTATNWMGNVAPSAGDVLVFPSNATSLIAVNNFSASTNFDGIVIGAAGYSLSGAAITLTEGIQTTYSSGNSTNSIPTGLSLGSSGFTPAIEVETGGELTQSGAITGTTGLALFGGGTLLLTATNSYTGSTSLSGSGTTLLVNGTVGTVQINSGTTLGGTGTVGNVTSVGGTISPGDQVGVSPDVLHVGSLLLDSNSTIIEELDGTTPGNGTTGYDQIVASGPITLGQATLKYSVGGGYVPANGDQLTIIENNSGSVVGGTFANLSQGASLLGYPLVINYFGGSNSQSVLLVGMPAPTVNVSGPTSTVYGTTETFTAQVTGSSGTPTGSVLFYNGSPSGGGTELGVGTLNFQGVATFTPSSSLTVTNSPYHIYGVYLPDSSSTYGSTVSLQPLTVTITPATLTVTATSEATVYGQAIPSPLPVTYSGFVNGDSASSLTTPATATTTGTSTSSPGMYPITPAGAVDPNYTFVYVPGILTISQASTTTTVSVPSSSIIAGGSATFTAQVSPASPGAGSPTGSVFFIFDNSEVFGPIAVNPTTGVATLTIPGLATGEFSVTAVYSGDTNFASSESTSSVFLVGKGEAEATVLTVPIRNAKGRVVGVELVAEVSPLPADTDVLLTGQVKFVYGARGYGTQTLTLTNGVATLRLPAARALGKYVYIRYNGDANYQATLSQSELVNGASLRAGARGEQIIAPGTSVKASARPALVRIESLIHAAHRKHRHA